MGNSGARSAGPIGCLVPGWSTGGAGVLKSAWMLYHLVGMSFSSSMNFVRARSLLLAMPASLVGDNVSDSPPGCQRARVVGARRARRAAGDASVFVKKIRLV